MSNDPVVKKELEYRRNNLYDWIQNKVISKCTDISHIEPCNVLITFFEQKVADEDLVKGLRASLEMKETELRGKCVDNESISIEDQVMRMYSGGNNTVKSISKKLGISIYKVNTIIDDKLKTNKHQQSKHK